MKIQAINFEGEICVICGGKIKCYDRYNNLLYNPITKDIQYCECSQCGNGYLPHWDTTTSTYVYKLRDYVVGNFEREYLKDTDLHVH